MRAIVPLATPDEVRNPRQAKFMVVYSRLHTPFALFCTRCHLTHISGHKLKMAIWRWRWLLKNRKTYAVLSL